MRESRGEHVQGFRRKDLGAADQSFNPVSGVPDVTREDRWGSDPRESRAADRRPRSTKNGTFRMKL